MWVEQDGCEDRGTTGVLGVSLCYSIFTGPTVGEFMACEFSAGHILLTLP
jgi:hypothetical protein